MAKVMYSATMSLDGFITGPCGDASWMTEFMGPNPGQAVQRGLGRAAVRAHHRAPDTPVPGVTFVGDLASVLAAPGPPSATST